MLTLEIPFSEVPVDYKFKLQNDLCMKSGNITFLKEVVNEFGDVESQEFIADLNHKVYLVEEQ